MEKSYEQSIVINDLLSFLVCKLKLIPKDKLLNCMRHYYSQSEIAHSQKSLLASLPIKKSTRHGRRVKHPDVLVAIYDCIQLIPEADMPIFVCEDLNHIPTVDADIPDDVDAKQNQNFMFIKDSKERKERGSAKPSNSKQTEVLEDTAREKGAVAVQCREEQKQMKLQISEMKSIITELKGGLQKFKYHSKIFTKEPKTEFIEKNNPINNLSFQTKVKKETQRERSEEDSDVSSDEDVEPKLSGVALIQKLIDEDAENNQTSFMQEGEWTESSFDSEDDFGELRSINENEENIERNSINLKDASKKQKTPVSSVVVVSAPSKTASSKSGPYLSDKSNQQTIEISDSSKMLGDGATAPDSESGEAEEEDGEGDGETRLDLRGCAPEKCPVCEVSFTSKACYDLHAKTHYTKGTYDCTFCDEQFSCREGLVRHFIPCFEEVKEHCDLSESTCATCGSFYADQKSLGKHEAYHSECRLYPCPHCSFRFFTSGALQMHIKNQHSPMNKFSCVMCNLTFPCNSYLVGHVASHTGARPFSCNICDYKSEAKKGIKQHIHTHAEKQTQHKYKCKDCSFTCSGNYIMVKHRRTEHKGPISCNLCEKTFLNPSAYRRHYEIHRGKNVFKCAICLYCTPFKRYLKKHMLTHPSGLKLECPRCGIPLSSRHTIGHHMRKYCRYSNINRSVD